MNARDIAELEGIVAERSRRQRKREGFAYVPHDLHPRQREFCALPHREALFGGAAGGAKTDALLAASQQGVLFSGYSALLLRRTYPALALPLAIMDRSHAWWDSTDAHWDGERKQWRFPSGAVIQFGYCDNPSDLTRYQSAEFQFIGVDELTEWPEDWYRFLFSRLRGTTDSRMPLRMRSATNPGGLGQEWVRERFRIPENVIVDEPIEVRDEESDRIFLPSRLEDNPSINRKDYEKSLKNLGPQRYEQLRWGRWIRDGEGLVYGEFRRERHVIDKLPELELGKKWTSLLAFDFGSACPSAVAVVKWREHDPTVYISACYQFTGLVDAFALEALRLDKVEQPIKMVGDTGGMGKTWELEWRSRFSLPLEPAEKHNKLGYISLMNSALHEGKVKVVGPTCKDLVDQWSKLPWSQGREGKREAAGFANHACDSALYGFRASTAFHNRPADTRQRTPEERIKAEMDAYHAREAQRIAQQNAERLQYDWDPLGEGFAGVPGSPEAWDRW